jgi:hypothetical protein
MGRVARYKKVKKSLSKATPSGGDRLSISNAGKDSKGGSNYFDTVGVWGLVDSGRKPKKRSRTSIKLRAQRNKKQPSLADGKGYFDLACNDVDDFDMKDLVGTLKKESNPTEMASFTATSSMVTHATDSLQPMEPINTTILASSTVQISTAPAVSLPLPQSNVSTAIPSMDLEEEKLHKKLKKQVEPKVPVVASEGRMPGETKRAYSKRVKIETRQIIQRANQLERNPEKRQKKKEFLTLKKKGGRKRKISSTRDGYNSDDEYANDRNKDIAPFDETEKDDYGNTDTSRPKLLTGEQALAARDRATRVQFGEQADRPPVFRVLPRGASKLKKKSSTTELTKTPFEIKSEQLAMDLMRRKVQAQYATIKARRRVNGDFHL